MPLEFAFSTEDSAQPHVQQPWVWFPGWGFEAEVFASLAHTLPGDHYWYRWTDHDRFEDAVEAALPHIPANAILVGWSLGGALAESIAQRLCKHAKDLSNPAKALVTMATPAKFCRAKQWPYGMPQKRFDGFVSSFATTPEKIMSRFLALNAQGIESPKSIIRLLNHHQLPTSDALAKQLNWLDQYDFTRSAKAACHCLHLFAEHDALVAPPHSHGLGRYEMIPGTCHALFIQQPELIRSQLIGICEIANRSNEPDCGNQLLG